MSISLCFLNRIRKMVSSTLSKEIEKDVFCLTMVFLYFCNASLFIKFTFFNLVFFLAVIQRGNDRCLFMCVFLVILKIHKSRISLKMGFIYNS